MRNNIDIPTSNSNPFSVNVWQHPPAWSCCSSTSTLLLALDRMAAALRPPIPLPMTLASRFSGTLPSVNPATAERRFWNMTHRKPTCNYHVVFPVQQLLESFFSSETWPTLLVMPICLCLVQEVACIQSHVFQEKPSSPKDRAMLCLCGAIRVVISRFVQN